MVTQLRSEELQQRKQRLLQAVSQLLRPQSGSAHPATIPVGLQNGNQNNHDMPAVDPVITEAAAEDDLPPPPPLGSPSASQAATVLPTSRSGMITEADIPVTEAHPASAAVEQKGMGMDMSPGAFQASAEGAGKRGRQRSAQEAAAWKEEQQELALERAILEIHWQQAEAEQDSVYLEEADDAHLAEDAEIEEGELAGQAMESAEDQPAPAAGTDAAWYQHLPPFYQQWGRAATGNASASADAGVQADESVGPGQGNESSGQAAAWEDWYQQQGYGGQDASAQHGGGQAREGTAEGGWQQWQTWQQQQNGSWAGAAPDWNAAGQQGHTTAGPLPWAAQGAGQEGHVSVPAALLQRYQMLEWAEWCRQYERWQAAYEQWYSWWSSAMWQASGYYGTGTGPDASAS